MKTLASLAAILIVSAAGAASAQEARIGWSDLNLGTVAGADAFDARVDAATRRMCNRATRPGSRISDRDFCRVAARNEAVRQLPGAARVDYARARSAIVL